MPPKKVPLTSSVEWQWVGSALTVLADGRRVYSSARLVDLDIAPFDVVLTQVDPDDPSTKLHKLCYWAGQVGLLYEENGDKKFMIRFFDAPAVYQKASKIKGERFRRGEMIETDLCESNPLSIIVKKVNWLSEDDDILGKSDSHGLPLAIYSDRMLVRCGSDGKLQNSMSDQLWPAPAEKRKERMLGVCPDLVWWVGACGENSKKRGRQNSIETPKKFPVLTNPPPQPQDVFRRAAHFLQLSVVPQKLPCRESERTQVEGFLKSALSCSGGLSGNVFYISGMPGTGKTATVLGVIKEFQGQFGFVHINALKLNTPNDIYT